MIAFDVMRSAGQRLAFMENFSRNTIEDETRPWRSLLHLEAACRIAELYIAWRCDVVLYQN